MMRFVIGGPISVYGYADPYDIHQIKTALNQLGYYQPDPMIGIEENREPAFFEALDRFRQERGLAASPWLMPYDETVQALNDEMRDLNPTGRYIWRTVGDDRVRDEHAMSEGQIFTWGFPPPGGHPSEDYNCRCWAEVIPARGLIQDERHRNQICLINLQITEGFENELKALKNKRAQLEEEIRAKETEIEELKNEIEKVIYNTLPNPTNIMLNLLDFKTELFLEKINQIIDRYGFVYNIGIITELKNRIRELENKIKNIQKQIEELNKEIDEKREEINAARERFNLLCPDFYTSS